MGKRTKSQHTAYAQLFLYAKSSFNHTYAYSSDTPTHTPAPAPSAKLSLITPPTPPAPIGDAGGVESVSGESREASAPPAPEEVSSGGGSGGWVHGEYELGRRMVREAENGEEAAVREVLLDSMDGGAVENNILGMHML
jgi:hypothetical protein